jgi:hypothetical protein
MTTVRKLTDEEQAELEPLLRKVHAHFDECEVCQAAPPGPVSTPAEVAATKMCDVGKDLQCRWLRFFEDRP